ncbi:MAG: DNA-protecting protein DprA [Dokdonella sp.]|nr:DNA-protecting protein DprA [Dokdonella sp.]
MKLVDSHRDLEAWLILLRAPGLGPATLRELLAAHGSAAAALAAARRGAHPRTQDADCRAWLAAPERALIDADLTWLDAPAHHLLVCDGADFPALLDEAPGAPAALFVDGDANLLWQAQIAIVGSRNATPAGMDNAHAFARALGQAGFAITSGLAEGIDTAAHEGALTIGAPTIAVLGTGPDRVYPARQTRLAQQIAASGALVSQFPPGTPAQQSHFPRRNRVIAGLALGTLVVEAGTRSGALITARNASEAGREVFAIPGSIHNPLARGCHALIRQGAKLVETTAEIVDELTPLARQLGASLRERLAATEEGAATPAQSAVAPRAADPDYARLYAALETDALDIDTLAARSGLAVPSLASMLLLLELEGEVVASAGGYARRPP